MSRIFHSRSVYTIGLAFIFIIAAFIPASTAHAQCIQVGGVVTCDGLDPDGFLSADPSLTVTVNAGATVETLPVWDVDAISLSGTGQTILNYGTIRPFLGDGITTNSFSDITNASTIIAYLNGIRLLDPVTSTNADNTVITNTGLIDGRLRGIIGGSDNTVNNTGTITSTVNEAIRLEDNNTITNSGTITSNAPGVPVYHGITLGSYNVVTNTVTGVITAYGGAGIFGNTYNTITNYGTIISYGPNTAGSFFDAGDGIAVDDNNTVINAAGGVIIATDVGIQVDANGVVLNDGSVTGEWGILAGGSSQITNNGTAVGTGGVAIIGSDQADTIVNNGTTDGDIDGRAGADAITNSGSVAGDITGNAGNDTIIMMTGGTVSGTVDGGADIDLLDMSDISSDVTVNMAAGTVSGTTFSTIANFENLTTGGGDDTLTGTAGDNVIDGGAGSDTYDASANATGMIVDLGAGTAIGDGTDTLLNIENATGGSGSDTLIGSAGDNVLNGGAGVDFLAGGEGDDTLIGGEDGDLLVGQEGNDTLDGGAGDDLIDGGVGDDTLNGGAGTDTLVGGAGNDTLTSDAPGADILDGGTDNDTITVTGTGEAAQVLGGDGNDTITNDGTVNGDVDGGAGNDRIVNNTSGTVDGNVVGGEGNDYIASTGVINGDIIAGAGNDWVRIIPGAVVTGTIGGGDGFDTLDGLFNTVRVGAEAWAARGGRFNSTDSVTINGILYSWSDFERILGQLLLAQFEDGRINPLDFAATSTGYCVGRGRLHIYGIDEQGGNFAYEVTGTQVKNALAQAFANGQHVLMNDVGGTQLWALADRSVEGVEQLQLMSPGYMFIFPANTCGLSD